MFKSLQAGRAVAAMMVVLFHLGATLAKDGYFGMKVLEIPFSFGSAGVEFFFVLSGFIVLNAHLDDIGRPERFYSYLRKRLLRIYPIYWLVFLPVFAMAWLVPSLREGMPQDLITIVKSLLLFPQDKLVVGGTGAPVIVVAWTLQYEMLFYLFFALLVLAPRVAILAGVLMLGCYLAGVIWSTDGFPFFLAFIAQDYVLLFGMGMLVAWLTGRKRALPGWLPGVCLTIGMIVFSTTALDVVLDLNLLESGRILIYGLAASLVVYGLVTSEKAGRAYLDNKSMLLMGDASYALYLIHFPLISVLCKFAMAVGMKSMGLTGALICFVVIFVACVAVAVLFHLWLERPIAAYLRKPKPV